jgi:tRNA(adenine34) deaminase
VSFDDAHWMSVALAEAAAAAARGEVPVGAVIVEGDELLASAGNEREATQDPTAHAEIVAIRRAAQKRGSWRLGGATLYVTLEPCPMCAGAIVLARIARLVYGAADPKAGAVETLFRLADDPRLNHRVAITAGVAAEEAGALLKAFFRARRPRGGESGE